MQLSPGQQSRDLDNNDGIPVVADLTAEIADAACTAALSPLGRPALGPRIETSPELLNRDEVTAELSRRYPRELRSMELGGSVTLRFRVLPDGRVDPFTIEPVRTTVPIDQEEAEDAAALVAEVFRFRPATRGGLPVAAWVSMDVSFTP